MADGIPSLSDRIRGGMSLYDMEARQAVMAFARWLDLNNDGDTVDDAIRLLQSTNDNPNITPLPDHYGSVAGRWPGDESDEEVNARIDEMS